MIKEIYIIPPVATYQKIVNLTDLRYVNFIFGSNGSGKTTISRIIGQSEGHKNCTLAWKNSTPLQTMVYNRDFVENNFNQENTVKGVFTLGDNQVEAEKKITSLRPEIGKITEQINSINNQLNGEGDKLGKREELKALEPKLTTICWKQKKKHDDYFKIAFKGVRNSSDSFKDRVLNEYVNNKLILLSLDDLKSKAKIIYSDNLESIQLLLTLFPLKLSTIENSDILQKNIVGNKDIDIALLIEKLGNSDWVKQGLEYHKHSSNKCPFCQQDTNEELSESLKAFFSDEYEREVNELSSLLNEYSSDAERLLFTLNNNLEIGNVFLNQDIYKSKIMALEERIKVNKKLLEEKQAEPSKKIVLNETKVIIDELEFIIKESNEKTIEHNNTVSNILVEKEKLTGEIWRFIISELESDIVKYNSEKEKLVRAIKGMESGLEVKLKDRKILGSEIKELEKQSTSIHPTKDAINGLLKAFGFDSFEIEVESDTNHYKICRKNGDDASRSLSEGEKTFITFLYFYSLIKGAQSSSGISADRVVVFDDPISSLDSDILYIVSSLIKGVIEEIRYQKGVIRQIFILTHNVYFHKELCFHKDRSKSNAMSHESFWMVKKQQDGSFVERCSDNPIRSAYELLWEDIKSSNTSSLNIQNTLRRILENYFTMWGGKSKDEICDLFDSKDKLICQSLFSWVNDGSHSIHDDLYINHGIQTNESYLRVFKEIFDRADQIGHYNMMVGI
ncbi:AAA family ATPase [Moellerella wisconsensis]|uniref:AAA family ATPase n=1 Tax=Moellerella wisconsensis TaxID=158849 RepID=UPI0030764470